MSADIVPFRSRDEIERDAWAERMLRKYRRMNEEQKAVMNRLIDALMPAGQKSVNTRPGDGGDAA